MGDPENEDMRDSVKRKGRIAHITLIIQPVNAPLCSFLKKTKRRKLNDGTANRQGPPCGHLPFAFCFLSLPFPCPPTHHNFSRLRFAMYLRLRRSPFSSSLRLLARVFFPFFVYLVCLVCAGV